MEEEKTTFHQKVIRLQSELKAPKGQYNSFGKYSYRSCEDILEGVKPLLSKYELVLTIEDTIVQIGERYYVKATATLTDGTSTIHTKAYARESEEKKGMDSSQVTGATSSYARKYALNGLFCIDDTKDTDTQESAIERKKKAVINKIIELAKVKNIADAEIIKLLNNKKSVDCSIEELNRVVEELKKR